MNADLSVAPEIAQLAVSPVLPPRPRATPAPRTVGRGAGELTRLAAAPQLWWDLVRFDPDDPVRIPVPGTPSAWLLVLPPGATAACRCQYATLLAGEAAEGAEAAEAAEGAEAAEKLTAPHPAAAAAPLRAGRVRVHGRPARHRVRGAGRGYSVSMHWAAAIPRGE